MDDQNVNDANGELTPQELEKLVQFQEVTGIEDVSLARLELIQHEWNVETAVQHHLSIQDSPERSSFRPRSQSFPNTSARRDFPEPVVREDAVTRYNGGIFGWIYYLLSLPMKLLFAFIYKLIIPYPRRLVDPLGDIISFVEEYEKDHGRVHPSFFQGSYSQALNHAKTELKFLIVYLHCKDNQDTPLFCRSVLSDTRVIDFINNTVIFWACSVTTGEGYRVSQALRENAYPFLAVIVLKDNKMTVVGRLEGPQDSVILLERLQAIIIDNEAYLVVARADRQERQMTAALRQEQDAAYLESLRADQEKARKRQEEQDAQTKQAEEEREHEQSILEERENRRRLKIEWVDKVPQEPEEGEAGIVHIVAKLPQGTRLNRRFYATESLSVLYYYIFCHPDSPDRFQVTTNFPRRILPCEPSESNPFPPSFKQFGLPQRCMLFVTDLDA